MTKEQRRVIEAWDVHFDSVRDGLNKEGWYDGRNDKVQKTFEGLEITKMLYFQIPTKLLTKEVKEKEDLTETASEPVKIKQKNKVVHSTKK